MSSNPQPSPTFTGRTLLLLACAAALCAPVTLSARAQEPATTPVQQQPPDGGPGGPGGPARGAEMQQHQLERMTRELSLTPDQVAQVKAIEEDGHQQMIALRNDSTAVGPDRRAKADAIREGQQAKIRAVLNDDQKTKYDAVLARMRERREGGPSGGQAPPPPPPPTN